MSKRISEYAPHYWAGFFDVIAWLSISNHACDCSQGTYWVFPTGFNLHLQVIWVSMTCSVTSVYTSGNKSSDHKVDAPSRIWCDVCVDNYIYSLWFKMIDCGTCISFLFSHRRFTGDIAEKAHHVTAVDFMQSFIDKNRKNNGAKFDNVDFVCADVTKLDLPKDRYVNVFTAIYNC